jgi:hypothetical protein
MELAIKDAKQRYEANLAEVSKLNKDKFISGVTEESKNKIKKSK